VPDFVGHTFLVHNGKVFQLGVRHRKHGGPQAREFSPTRIFKKHGAHTAKVAK
jgi:small subunit ribosomal protein S19